MNTVLFVYLQSLSVNQSEWVNVKVPTTTTHLTMTLGKVALTSSWEPTPSGNVPKRLVWVYLSSALKCHSTFGVMDVAITLVWVSGE